VRRRKKRARKLQDVCNQLRPTCDTPLSSTPNFERIFCQRIFLYDWAVMNTTFREPTKASPEPWAVHRRRELEERRNSIDEALSRNRAEINGLKICVERSLDEGREELDRLSGERARLMQEWNFVLGELAVLTPTTEFGRR
jgi:hypothetical protein